MTEKFDISYSSTEGKYATSVIRAITGNLYIIHKVKISKRKKLESLSEQTLSLEPMCSHVMINPTFNIVGFSNESEEDCQRDFIRALSVFTEVHNKRNILLDIFHNDWNMILKQFAYYKFEKNVDSDKILGYLRNPKDNNYVFNLPFDISF